MQRARRRTKLASVPPTAPGGEAERDRMTTMRTSRGMWGG